MEIRFLYGIVNAFTTWLGYSFLFTLTMGTRTATGSTQPSSPTSVDETGLLIASVLVSVILGLMVAIGSAVYYFFFPMVCNRKKSYVFLFFSSGSIGFFTYFFLLFMDIYIVEDILQLIVLMLGTGLFISAFNRFFVLAWDGVVCCTGRNISVENAAMTFGGIMGLVLFVQNVVKI